MWWRPCCSIFLFIVVVPFFYFLFVWFCELAILFWGFHPRRTTCSRFFLRVSEPVVDARASSLLHGLLRLFDGVIPSSIIYGSLQYRKMSLASVTYRQHSTAPSSYRLRLFVAVFHNTFVCLFLLFVCFSFVCLFLLFVCFSFFCLFVLYDDCGAICPRTSNPPSLLFHADDDDDDGMFRPPGLHLISYRRSIGFIVRTTRRQTDTTKQKAENLPLRAL